MLEAWRQLIVSALAVRVAVKSLNGTGGERKATAAGEQREIGCLRGGFHVVSIKPL